MVRPVRCGRATAALLAAAAFALAAPRAGAQNRAPNGELDVDAKPWDTGGAGASLGWIDDGDHSGCPVGVSGAGRAGNAAVAAGAEFGYSVCVMGLADGVEHSFGVDLRFPAGQGRTGSARLVVVWLPSFDCTGVSADFDETATLDSTDAPGEWVTLGLDSATSPPGIGSAGLVVRLQKNEAGGELAVEFDGAYLAPKPGFLLADGVDRGSTCHWHLAVP